MQFLSGHRRMNDSLIVGIATIVLICGMLSHTASAAARKLDGTCINPWVFFDLGDTLIDTKTTNFEKVYFLPNAYEHLQELKAKKYKIGLIVNVPEDFGPDDQTKLVKLKNMVAAKWTDTKQFDWSIFADRILLPKTNAERKPSPILFERAKSMALVEHCAALFEGESAEEVRAASAVGMHGFVVGTSKGFFMTVDRVARLFRINRKKS